MTPPKPTRQQVVELFKDAVFRDVVSGDEIADILVKAGIAEEPRPSGWYPYRRLGCPQQHVSIREVAYWDGVNWFAPSGLVKLFAAPVHIGPRITPPEEK